MGRNGRRTFKKLIWAGEAAVEGHLIDRGEPNEVLTDALRFGIDPALLDDDVTDEGIWEEHLPALQVFLSVMNQWRAVATAQGPIHYLGLDYSAVAAGLGLAGITVPPALWADVQLIEAGALIALNRNRML